MSSDPISRAIAAITEEHAARVRVIKAASEALVAPKRAELLAARANADRFERTELRAIDAWRRKAVAAVRSGAPSFREAAE